MREILMISAILLYSTISLAQTPTPDVDLNNDGVLDYKDLLVFSEGWETKSTPTPTPLVITLDTVSDVTIEFVKIPAGRFLHGGTQW